MQNQSKGATPAKATPWHRRIHGEPSLSEIVEDPITQLIMGSDGVTRAELTRLVDQIKGQTEIAA